MIVAVVSPASVAKKLIAAAIVVGIAVAIVINLIKRNSIVRYLY